MWDLRWVLLGLGALVVVGVFLWSKGVGSRRLFLELARRNRTEPSFGHDGSPATTPDPASGASESPAEKPARASPDRVITLRLIPRGDELNSARAVKALMGAGLKHGRYGIFHRDDVAGEPAFSVASLTEPGSFDLENLQDTSIAGLSFFI